MPTEAGSGGNDNEEGTSLLCHAGSTEKLEYPLLNGYLMYFSNFLRHRGNKFSILVSARPTYFRMASGGE